MSEVKLNAELRSEFGKGAARRLRRAKQVPAVLYGHGTDPIHISLPAHETQLALRAANVLLTLMIEGKAQLALPKQVQRDPIRNTVEHIDLVVVRKGETVTVNVPLVTIGDPISDVMIVMDQQSISLEVLATNIPAQIEIEVANLQVGDTVTAADLNLPEGAVFPGEPSDLMLAAHAAPSQEQLDAELDAAVEATEGDTAAPAPAEESASSGDEA